MGKHTRSPFEEAPNPQLRVHELAKELNVTSKALLGFLGREGYRIRSASSFLSEEITSFVRSVAASETGFANFTPPASPNAPSRGRHAAP